MPGADMFAQTAGSSAGTVGVLGDTPTTTSMLAALQDSFNVESAGAFDMNSFVDTSAGANAASGGSAGAMQPGANGTMFPDFMGGGNGFDVGVGGGMGGFGAHDLGGLSDHSQGSEHNSQAGSAVHSHHGSPESGLGAKEEPSG